MSPTPSAQDRLRVLVVPSWYPDAESPTHGIFVQQQVEALSSVCEVAVLYVKQERPSRVAVPVREGGVAVVRSGFAVPDGTGSLLSRGRVALELAREYRRALLDGMAAISESWGTPDLIHAHASIPAAIGSQMLADRMQVPYVITEHQAEFLSESPPLHSASGRIMPWRARRSMRRSSAVIAVSTHLARALHREGYSDELVVIPNMVPGVDRSPGPKPVRDDGLAHLAHVSLLSAYEKNIPMLLQALSLLDRRGALFLMDFIGDGPDRHALEAQAAEMGLLDRRVRFLGAKSSFEVGRLLSESDFSVVSSRYETFSMAAAESLSAGRPVVSTRCGGPEDFIDSSVGLLVANNDVEAMAAGILWMIDHHSEFDPKTLNERVRERLSPDVVVGQLVDLYREVLGRDDSGGGKSIALQ